MDKKRKNPFQCNKEGKTALSTWQKDWRCTIIERGSTIIIYFNLCSIYANSNDRRPFYHRVLQISLEAFRTSPVESLHVEEIYPSLENRRIKISMQYTTKLKAYPLNPALDCVFNPLHEYVYDKQPNTIQSFRLRIRSHFEIYNTKETFMANSNTYL